MYSLWAIKRRSKIIFWFTTIMFILLSAYITITTYSPPSCYDGKRNKGEVGVDCGGVCDIMCPSQVKMPNIIWVRSFEISNGLWTAIAYTENSNPQAYAPKERYKFTLYDKDNNIIAEREGETFINGNVALPVLEGRINVGNNIPYRTSFEWLGTLPWYKLKSTFNVVIKKQVLKDYDSKPRITAKLISREPFLLRDIEVVVIVYDKKQNAISASKTYVDKLSPRSERNISFTWPKPFTTKPSRWELMPMIPPQKD